jgi:DNA repair exonuclease SbcCD ATPase subunit
MSIHFTKLYYKNFLSTGNAGSTILLDRSPTTLVQGPSGAGKSTMIDALCFALFGKPFRNINKPQLINSVNQKQCEVSVEFRVGSKEYKVIRGIKPNKFEIYCDGKMISQDAAVKDYQKVLEQQILMMSFKTFTQIVILGSTAYTPFMQLSASARREVIEDILDIGIFSTMNTLLKQQMQETKDEQVIVDNDIRTLKEKAEGLKRLIDVLNTKQDEEADLLRESINTTNTQIQEAELLLEQKVLHNKELVAKTKKLKELIDASNSLLETITVGKVEVDHLTSQKTFFAENDTCPTCSQHIAEDHKHSMVNTLVASLQAAEEKVTQYTDMRTKVKDRIQTIQEIVEQVNSIDNEISSIKTSITMLQEKQLSDIDNLEKLTSGSTDIEGPTNELKAVAKNVLALVERKKALAEQRQMQESASMLLRDTGIKTAIIKEYLPIINKLINKYLNDLELFIEFNLDESFNEVIKSRHRDEFTYGNFSAGESLRLDLSMLFAWRHIAKLKNSAACNLLILDEILVGRLDASSSDIVISLINQLANDGTNIFAISHGDHLQDKFRGLIQFRKEGDFSIMY